MKFLPYDQDQLVKLAAQGGIPDQVHVFDLPQLRAINAALGARRPLLVSGEPGTGKSQLARAAAHELERAFVPFVVDSQTEARDLAYELDSLARLGEAQLAGALKDEDCDVARKRLALENFVRPGPLWWAFDWKSAEHQAAISSAPMRMEDRDKALKNGCVVLIDEIDKAESEVPNGLLEALGSGLLRPPGRAKPIEAQKTNPPLVVITTNEERALPNAFKRRCLFLKLELPDVEKAEGELKKLLILRGHAHFPEVDANGDVLVAAADMLISDRKKAIKDGKRPLPGQAEYLDLLRAVLALHPRSVERQVTALGQISCYALRKYAD